jgi:IS30 family transposase
MPRGPELTSFEIGQILAYRDLGLGPTDIGRKICRDKSTISRFLKDPENYGSNKVQEDHELWTRARNAAFLMPLKQVNIRQISLD